jgi:predicted short-subunit dehydrogenase-like oxidoreductase (DUF2520 family)
MDIVIIGTGNTASILGHKLKAAGHDILQIYGRNAKTASDLAYELDTESTNYWAVVNRNADVYLLAVSDIAVAEVVKELALPDKTIVHTAASVSKEVLNKAEHYGVFYPLQSLKKDSTYLPDIPIIIDASDEMTLGVLHNLANSITDKVIKAGDEERMKLHLAAVLSNNFVNHLYALAESYCQKEGLDFRLLIPLIKETALRVETISPLQAQTGPALRHDISTIQKHEELLVNYPHLRKIYHLFTESIWNEQTLS